MMGMRVAQSMDSVLLKLLGLLPPSVADALREHANECARQLKPLLSAIKNEASRLLAPMDAQLLQPLIRQYRPRLQQLAWRVDVALAPLRPWQVALLAAGTTAALIAAAMRAARTHAAIQRRGGLRQVVFQRLRELPIVRGLLAREISKIASELRESVREKAGCEAPAMVLPRAGLPAAAVLAQLARRESRNLRVAPGASPLSGVVYMSDEKHKALLDEAFKMFSWTNPLHADVFPAVRQLEAEVVAMTAAMLGGRAAGPGRHVCGAMTSGGTESIIMAMKASRDYMRARGRCSGASPPEVVLGPSAHAAYWKGAEYLGLKLVLLPLGRDYRLHGDCVARAINRRTCLVVASAPGFPHGVIDDVAGIAAAASRAGVPCHVDACLGGFVLPFARRLGHQVPLFDFSVRGVTSMSVDTHKFGMAHKGTSVVLYASPQLRRHQYTSITEWTGGLYISPSLAGSRNGALIAAAWASLVHLGENGLLDAADSIMSAAAAFQEQLAARLPELQVVGRPCGSVVAFKAVRPAQLNVYLLNDLLTKRGWHLNALQAPPALHFCFTAQHSRATVDALVNDLRGAVDQLLRGGPAPPSGGAAPLYGLSGVSPDRGLVGEFLVAYQDAMLDTT